MRKKDTQNGNGLGEKRELSLQELIANVKEEFVDPSVGSSLSSLTAESFGDDIKTNGRIQSTTESISSLALDIGANPNDVHVKAGLMAAIASTDFDLTTEAFSDIEDMYTIENFSKATPQDIASYNFSFNYSVTKQEPLVEAFFPTVIQPIGTRAIKIELDVDYIVDPFSRDDALSSSAKENAIPFILTINDENFFTNKNILVPDSQKKVSWDSFFVKDLEHDATNVVTGEPIKTAPYVAGIMIPLMDLGQTSEEAQRGEFDHKTTLAPFPEITNLYFKVGLAEYAKIDVTDSPAFAYTETGTGDSLGIVLTAVGNLIVTPSNMVDLLTLNQLSTFATLPSGYMVEYAIEFGGSGNLRDGTTTHCNIFEVSRIIDASGVTVPTTHANYGVWLAEAQSLNKEGFVGQDIKAFIVNDDISRVGRRITLREKFDNHPLDPDSPVIIEAPLKKFSNGSNRTDAEYIPFLVKHSLTSIDHTGIRAIINRVNYLRSNSSASTDIKTSGIARYIVKPFFKSISLNLATEIDSLTATGRSSDIKSAFDNNVKVLVSQMITDSNYGEVVKGRKDTIDLAIGVHSSLAKFIGTSVSLGDGLVCKIFSTEKPSFKGRAIIGIVNFGADRNDKIDILSFGTYVFTPVVVGELNEAKNRSVISQTLGKHIPHLPIVGEIIVTGLEESLKKIAQHNLNGTLL